MCTRQADTGGAGVGSAADARPAGPGPLSGVFRTPWGDGSVTVWQGRLAGVELPPLVGEGKAGGRESSPGGCGAALGSGDAGARRDRGLVERWVGELESYFRGERLSWTMDEVGLEGPTMSAFTRGVYEMLLTVPAGVTVSYGTLAEMAGFPRASRAVGTAMATNPIPIVVPCHRVIRSDGSLGKYGSDPAWKERLLAHERRHAGGEGGER